MSVSIIDNTALIEADLKGKESLFLRNFMDDVQKYSDPKTPMKTGRLRQSVLKQVLGTNGKMVWLKEYAAPQEVGRTRGHAITHYTTPGTGKDFAKDGVIEAVKHVDETMKRSGLIT